MVKDRMPPLGGGDPPQQPNPSGIIQREIIDVGALSIRTNDRGSIDPELADENSSVQQRQTQNSAEIEDLEDTQAVASPILPKLPQSTQSLMP
jgi:hypothetical protein